MIFSGNRYALFGNMLQRQAVEARMSRPTHVYIVASPRPRTGTTLLARALIEFHRTEARPVGAFDLDRLDGMLAQHLPTVAVRADIADTRGQVALFDQLIVADGIPKVVDVGAHVYEPFFRLTEQISFAEEALRCAVNPVILFAANTEPQSVKAYAQLRERFPGLTLTPVYNDGIARAQSLRQDFPSTSIKTMALRVPALSPALRTIIDRPPFSFAEFKHAPPPDMPQLLVNELDSWLRRVYLLIREMEGRVLLSNLRSSMEDAQAGEPHHEAPPPT
jgi:hypothetical protein